MAVTFDKLLGKPLLHSHTKDLDTRYLKLSGGTMTGLLTLSGAPTADLHAATKKYVDDNAGGVSDHSLLSNLDYASAGHTGFLQDAADVIKDTHIDWGTGANQVSAVDLPIADAGSYFVGTDVEAVLQEAGKETTYADSPGIMTGGEISEGTNAGTFKVAALTAYLRSTNSSTGSLVYVTLGEQDNQPITTADTTYFVCLDYNGGTPQIVLSTTNPYGRTSSPDKTQIPIGKVRKDGSDNVHFISGGFNLQDGVMKLHQRAGTLRAKELTSGSTIAYSGTNNFTMSAGIAYVGINRVILDSYDSATTQFTPIYRDGSGGWTEGAPRNTIDYAHYDDGDGTLGNVGVSKYGCHWVYKHIDDNHVYVVYGRGSYKLAEAELQGEPSRPDQLTDFGCLIGKIIAPQSGGSFAVIQMVTDTFFVGTSVSDHGALGGLDDDDHPQYLLADGSRNLTGNLAVDAGITIDGIDIGTAVPLNTTHRTSDGSDHSFIDQSVVSGASPTFNGANFTGIPDGALNTDYVEVAGDTMTGNLQLNDGIKLLLGTGSDGEIYSSSDNLYIANVTQDKDIYFNVNDGGVTKTPLFIDGSTGRVGIGTTGPGAVLHLVKSGGDKEMLHAEYAGDNQFEPLLRFKKARGSISSPSVVSNNDHLGTFYFQGYDGTQYTNAGYFAVDVSGSISNGVVPGAMRFAIYDTSGAASTLLYLKSDKTVDIGSGVSEGWNVNIKGDLYVDEWCSVLGITDRSPYEGDIEKALTAVKSMQTKGKGKLDHDKLDPIIKSEKNGSLGRNLSASVSVNNRVIQYLVDEVEKLSNKLGSLGVEIAKIKAELSIDGGVK